MGHLQRGFTLIEVMVIVAIIAILAAVALASMQEYAIRTKVCEAILAHERVPHDRLGDLSGRGSAAPGANGWGCESSSAQSKYVNKLETSAGRGRYRDDPGNRRRPGRHRDHADSAERRRRARDRRRGHGHARSHLGLRRHRDHGQSRYCLPPAAAFEDNAMTLVRLKLCRLLGGFWWSRRDGWYGRFVESGAYPVTLDLFVAAGFACVLAVLGYAAFARTAGTLTGAVVTVMVYLLAIAFLTSFGASVTQSRRHEGVPAEVLARCRKLLEQHDFVLGGSSADGIVATRGAGAGAESNWRSCPLQLEATVSPDGNATLLSVRCTGESATHRFVRQLILKTAEAAANLDHPALKSLDKTLVRRPGALFQGGLGTAVLGAMVVCAVLGTLAVVGVSYRLAAYVLEMSQANAAKDEMRRLQVQLTSRIDAALHVEAGQAGGEAREKRHHGHRARRRTARTGSVQRSGRAARGRGGTARESRPLQSGERAMGPR
jgi:prepilin-type N-terminal cleavage/methylation domain-containing protein